ncbi:MAG: FG-GAP-like repeat-containing protein, partial [Chloroflexota bacterium]|nr:FG-GAP-like repeat-containing protein [Chloroflexota bacterium]
MPRRLAVGLWALVLAAAATPATVTPVRAHSCTGWRSDLLPPGSIRVFRTDGPAAGTVQTVNFRFYVETVMAAEWPGYWPAETLKAGAVAVKQYGWYHATRYRGKTDRAGNCYDVVDYWADQVYRPEKRLATSSHRAAVAATWPLTLRRSGLFFATGYHAGDAVPCGSNANGIRIYQWSAYDCGRRGYPMEWILRRYYYPGLEVVRPGLHNLIGGYFGDGAVLAPGSRVGTTRPIPYMSGGSSLARAASFETGVARSRILGSVSADVTGDGRDDLVLLTADGTNDQSLRVLRGTGSGYAPIQRWWFARDELPNWGIRLVVGDYDADGRADAGLLAANSTSRSTFYMLRSLGSAFARKQRWWSGRVDVRRVAAWGGDATGDGRGDLTLQIDLGRGGLSYWLVPARLAGGSLGIATRWLYARELRRATTRTVATDVNRDGREDLLVAHPRGTGTRLTALVSAGRAFVRDPLWESGSLPWSRVKIGAGDVTGDGRGEVVLFQDGGSAGTRVVAFRSYGGAMAPAFWRDDRALRWSSANPY